MRRWVWAAVGLALTVWLGAFSHAADAPAEAIVTDAENKEVKVADLKFTTGIRRLTWLADPGGATEEAKKGPLVLEVREPHSTTYVKGVVTFVPLGSVESIKYDYDKQVATVAVKGLSEPVAGTLQFKGLNVLGFSGMADGKMAAFSGGAFAKGNIKAVSFPDAQPLPKREVRLPWLVQIDQPKAMNPTLKASSFKFLYQFPGGPDLLADAGMVRKGEALKLDGVTLYTALAVDLNANMIAAEVQVGDKEKVVLIPLTIEKDGKIGTLAGLFGEVDAGWKLFPLQVIKTMKRQRRD
jgi:hypothetical protein